ncbi:MAG: bifunctional serine/threonine-protein kinase/formylglycine-generating enzyme family protein [Anaerolineae bacterium]|nr:bifunctional serine/threonine-protein kinase/formylglycine-generating enzyme family protein [Anaerolineae bacterium]
MKSVTQVGRYRIKSLLGRGGMAEVYLAYDPQFNREVAVKLITSVQASDEMARARFEREARMIASLEHAAILPVYDMGEADGQPYLVMRYVTGGSMEQRLKNGPYRVDEVAAILPGLASALDYAHSRGIVHRDIKPANILFAADGQAMLADFGVAKDQQSTLMLSSPGLLMGTPAYMSPEQVRALADVPLDGRSDIYSLGATLFHALSGEAPFKADSVFKMMDAHLREPPPNICRVNPQLPNGLQAVFDKAMAKLPAQRYATAKQFSQAFQSVLRQPVAQPSAPVPIVMPAATKSPLITRRIALLGSGGLALLGLGAVALRIAPLLTSTPPQAPIATSQLTESKPQATPNPTTTQSAAKPTETVLAATRTTAPTLTPTVTVATAPTTAPASAAKPTASIAPSKPTVAPSGVLPANTIAGLAWVRIPAGGFIMGSDDKGEDEKPQHRANLPEYSISKTPVTVAQFAAFVKATSYPADPNALRSNKDNDPVNYVSWDDAQAFCKWLSGVSGRKVRLPNEAEWEKAARGTDGRTFPWGEAAATSDYANYLGGIDDTTPVGKYSPRGDSPYGCVDMAGNVLEWTSSLYKVYPYSVDESTEFIEGKDLRVLRGGAFNFDDFYLRCACRIAYSVDTRYDNVGFRIAFAA